jgi:hypothetical protein
MSFQLTRQHCGEDWKEHERIPVLEIIVGKTTCLIVK